MNIKHAGAHAEHKRRVQSESPPGESGLPLTAKAVVLPSVQICLLALMLWLGEQVIAADSVSGFVLGPRIEKAGNAWKIAFSVSASTDATVAILSSEGRVVKHLAAGVLGATAPEPFKPGLQQELVWDGRDDSGCLVSEGARLRVSLGLKPEFSRLLCSAPPGVASRGPIGMAVDRLGTLYIVEGDLWVYPPGNAGVTQVLSVKAFDREGNYIRTVVPFRADWPPERVSEVEFLNTVDGRRIPLSWQSRHRTYCGFTRGAPRTTRHVPLITSDGRLIFPHGKGRQLLAVGTDGSVPKDKYAGPVLQERFTSGGNTFLALSPDGNTLYVAGVLAKQDREHTHVTCHAVYRVGMDATNPAVVFLGKVDLPGTGEGEFNDPRGLDVDAQGRLWVCDYMNDRVQIFDAGGTFVRALAVPGPEQVRVNAKNGAVYVLSVRDRGRRDSYTEELSWDTFEDKAIVKFSSLEEWKEAARLELPKRKKHMHDAGPIVALDATGDQPVLWIANVGRQELDDVLWKVVDRGQTLEKVGHAVTRLDRHAACSPPLAADRRNNEVYAFGTPEGSVRIDAASGRISKIELAGEVGKTALSGAGSAAVGPDGMLYLRSANPLQKAANAWHIRRFDRRGALIPFEAAGEFIATNGRKQRGSPEFASSFSVGSDGRLYVVGMISKDDWTARLDLYERDGRLLKPALVQMTANPGAVRVDLAGRLYLSDTLRPKEKSFPEFYPSDPMSHLCKWYGTLFRFSPAGGVISPANIASTTYFGRENSLMKVEGAQWSFYGISPMPQQAGCMCVVSDFDADDWGRVWVPDAPGYCVAVLDAAGNVITRFGSYGNHDAKGAGSAVAQPPIPFWSPERVAVLDNDAFVVDSLNERIVQVRLANQICEERPVP